MILQAVSGIAHSEKVSQITSCKTVWETYLNLQGAMGMHIWKTRRMIDASAESDVLKKHQI